MYIEGISKFGFSAGPKPNLEYTYIDQLTSALTMQHLALSAIQYFGTVYGSR